VEEARHQISREARLAKIRGIKCPLILIDDLLDYERPSDLPPGEVFQDMISRHFNGRCYRSDTKTIATILLRSLLVYAQQERLQFDMATAKVVHFKELPPVWKRENVFFQKILRTEKVLLLAVIPRVLNHWWYTRPSDFRATLQNNYQF
jgi:hypothetical protein